MCTNKCILFFLIVAFILCLICRAEINRVVVVNALDMESLTIAIQFGENLKLSGSNSLQSVSLLNSIKLFTFKNTFDECDANLKERMRQLDVEFYVKKPLEDKSIYGSKKGVPEMVSNIMESLLVSSKLSIEPSSSSPIFHQPTDRQDLIIAISFFRSSRPNATKELLESAGKDVEQAIDDATGN